MSGDSDELKKRVHCMIGTQGQGNCIDPVNEGRINYVGWINKLVLNVTTETMLEINGTIMMLMLAKNLWTEKSIVQTHGEIQSVHSVQPKWEIQMEMSTGWNVKF